MPAYIPSRRNPGVHIVSPAAHNLVSGVGGGVGGGDVINLFVIEVRKLFQGCLLCTYQSGKRRRNLGSCSETGAQREMERERELCGSSLWNSSSCYFCELHATTHAWHQSITHKHTLHVVHTCNKPFPLTVGWEGWCRCVESGPRSFGLQGRGERERNLPSPPLSLFVSPYLLV